MSAPTRKELREVDIWRRVSNGIKSGKTIRQLERQDPGLRYKLNLQLCLDSLGRW